MESDLTQEQVAERLEWSPSKISRHERAMTSLRPREVERLLDYYQISGARRAGTADLADDAAQKGWWEEYVGSLTDDYQQFVGLEHKVTSIAIWHIAWGAVFDRTKNGKISQRKLANQPGV